ncbi:MAG: RDD family protein [Elusimicrobiales bacterium]|nr:RDD family protein [Elusimicrobiales bacterium]MCK5358698.1 RDD family protein [Elusimicrobiales bacterium]MCK5582381.1 RDD family protein [Elusimicrobiales bacterium]
MEENTQETQKPVESAQEAPQANAQQTEQSQQTEQPQQAAQPQQTEQTQQTEQPKYQAANYQKANFGKRFVALLIDAGCCFVVGFIPILGWIAGILYTFARDGIDFGGLDNRSIGKKVMGLRVINTETGTRCNYKDSVIRQIVFVVPILNFLVALVELVVVLSDDKGIRLGDKLAKTMVIEEV